MEIKLLEIIFSKNINTWICDAARKLKLEENLCFQLRKILESTRRKKTLKERYLVYSEVENWQVHTWTNIAIDDAWTIGKCIHELEYSWTVINEIHEFNIKHVFNLFIM